jgi:DNA-binding transcriptional ArsR family regulator
MADQLLDRILREIRDRRDASRDAYEESQRLEAALAALGTTSLGGSSNSERTGSRRRAPASSNSERTGSRHRAPASSQAPRGENLRRIHEALRERPGASVGELATVTRIARRTLSSTLAKLRREGVIERADLPSGVAGYRLRQPPADGAAAETPSDTRVASSSENSSS